MRKREEEHMTGNMTAMIDVVFQLIIFFVCTTNMQDSSVNAEISLPLAPHGPEISAKDPREINIDVNPKGQISIGTSPLSQGALLGILRKTVADQGHDIPVVIRADGDVVHEEVKKVMDACSSAGLSKIQFAALREKSK